MTDTVLNNPVTRDVVTLHSPRPVRARDALVITTELPAGAAGSPLHRHARLTETFEMLEGCVTFQVGKTERALAAGSSVTVRPKTVHGFRNASNSPAVLRCTVTPVAVADPNRPAPPRGPAAPRCRLTRSFNLHIREPLR